MFIYDWLLRSSSWRRRRSTSCLMRFSRKRLRPMFDSLEEAFGKLQLAPDRRDQGHRDGEGGLGPSTRSARACSTSSRRSRTGSSGRTSRSCPTRRAIQLVTLGHDRPLPLRRLAPGARRRDDRSASSWRSTRSCCWRTARSSLCSAIWDDFQYGTVLLNRLNDIVEHEPEQGSDRCAAARRCGRSRGGSSSSNVGFRYTPISPPILEGITLDVEPGTMVAIVGRSGSRQDDARPLPRRPARADRRARSTSTASTCARSTTATCGAQIGYVLQENHLFDDTIARNIAFGDEEPDMRRSRLGGAGCERARVRRAAAARLRDADRRDRAAALRRTAPADRDRARALPTSRRCSSSTRRRARSTPSRSAPCRRTWTRSSRDGRRS